MENKNNERIIVGMSEVHLAELERIEYQKLQNDNFFDFWESFTDKAFSMNLEISEDKDFIRNIWYKRNQLSIDDAIKFYTR